MSRFVRIFSLLMGITCMGTASYIFLITQHEEHVAKTVSHNLAISLGQVIETNDSLPNSQTIYNSEANQPECAVVESDKMEMKTTIINGEHYVGVLLVPSLGLELPIAQNCNDSNLDNTPCLYSGCIDDNNLVIAGHNYKAHFGEIHHLELGSCASLMDAAGQIYDYYLVKMEQVNENDLYSIISGDWDMTLFTCVYGDNSQRNVLRFEFHKEESS